MGAELGGRIDGVLARGHGVDAAVERVLRPGPDLDARLLVVFAVAFHEAGLERVDDHGRGLVEAAARFVHAQAEGGELAPRQATAEAQPQPALAQQVEHGGVLGDAQRIVPGQDHRRRADIDVRAERREMRHQREVVGHERVVVEVMLGRPQAIEAEVGGEPRQPDLLVPHAIVGAVVPAVAGEHHHHADIHEASSIRLSDCSDGKCFHGPMPAASPRHRSVRQAASRRQRQEARIGTSVRAWASSSRALISGASTRVAAPRQAFVQAVQAPHVVGMLVGAGELAVVAEVRAIDRLGLREMPLLQQERAQRMARRLHPAPRLVVGQRIVELDGAAQMGEGRVDVAAAVFQLAAQHLGGDVEKVLDGVVVHQPRVGHARLGGAEGLARLLGLGDLAQHRMGHALGVEHHGRGRAVEIAVLGQLLGDDLAPLAEADQHVLLHREEAARESRPSAATGS